MSREIYRSRELEISADGIVEIFQSEKFKKKIFGIADKLRNSDEYYESGFVVVKGLRAKSFDFATHMDVDYYSTGLGEKGLVRYNRLLEQKKIPIINLHFHKPNYWSDKYERSSYMPSKEDLSNLFYFREDIIKTLNLDGFPLGVISWVKGPSNIEMLVYQASLLSPTGYRTFMDYEACVKQCRSKEEITETLNDYGYKASFVNYSREGFSEDDKQKLNSFNLKLKSLNLNPTK